jgi:hypothetical protein
MASGHVNRIKRPNTWLHRPKPATSDSPCQPGAVHTWQILLQKSFCTGDQNSPGCRRDFRVKMWGTSSPDDKLTDDLGNVIEAAQIGVRQSDRLTAGKSSPGNFGLLQHNLPTASLPPFAERNLWNIAPQASINPAWRPRT